MIITTTPNDLCAELHNRMPVVLGPETWPAWLGEEPADACQLKAVLAPYPTDEMTAGPSAMQVNGSANVLLIEQLCVVANAEWQKERGALKTIEGEASELSGEEPGKPMKPQVH